MPNPARRLLAYALVIGAALAAPVLAQDPSVLAKRYPLAQNRERDEPAPKQGLRATHLRCEYAENPLGIDEPRPRLSWWLEGNPQIRGQSQTAYRIEVSSTPGGKPDLWEGKGGSEQLQIPYEGKPLVSGQRAYWRVRVWDEHHRRSGWSKPAFWEMGLLRPEDWHARWIRGPKPQPQTDEERLQENPAPLFRREFSLRNKIARARAYVTGLGYYELRLNGEKVGDHVLDPGWTDYDKRIYYATYDVTPMLRRGANAAGIMLGGGWYDPAPVPLFGRFNLRKMLPVGQSCALALIEVRYADGSTERIGTDEAWKTADGPVVKDSVYLGEEYDARRELPGWDRPGFNDPAWQAAVPADPPKGRVQAQYAPPIRVTRRLQPVKITSPKPGVHIVDMGQNFAGWVWLRVKGPAGARVSLRYGELVYPDGTLNVMTSVAGQLKGRNPSYPKSLPIPAQQLDTYTLRGGAPEEWHPRFTFHGFRYVELTGFPGTPTLDTLQGLRLNADVEQVGQFTCSNSLFNRIQEMCDWTFRSNLFSVQSDCPHREKLGYGGDIVASSEAFIYNYDMSRFYAKVVRDFGDDQRPNGGFTETAPYVGIADQGLGDGAGPIGWGTAHPLLLWQLYQYYGDKRLIEEQYSAAQRWMELLQSKAQDGILVNGIGDHESLAPKDTAVSGTAFYYYNAVLMERLARVLGRTEDQTAYATLAGSIKQAFVRKFRNHDDSYGAGTQACQSFALSLGLAANRLETLARLSERIKKNDGHLDTGIFGTKYALESLDEFGQYGTAYKIVNSTSFPGWGYMLDHGATTLWEHWAQEERIYSHNHPMFGSISEWFYKWAGGIQPDSAAAGFNRILIAIPPAQHLSSGTCRYESARGPVISSWHSTGNRARWDLTIPPNSTAEIAAPSRGPRLENAGAIGVPLLIESQWRVRIVSGHYRVNLKLPE